MLDQHDAVSEPSAPDLHAADTAREAQFASFAAALDALVAEVQAEIGEEDVRYIERLDRLSRRIGWLGRGLIHFSFEPVGFLAGVVALAVHKQIQAVEIGHTVLHGTYDQLPVSKQLRSKSHRWDVPVSEEAWRYHHNVLHHGFTNLMGKDPDVDWGIWRTSESAEHQPHHWVQVPVMFLGLAPNLWSAVNLHVTGVVDCYVGDTRVLRDRSMESKLRAHRLALWKYARSFAKEYLFWPALAGPFFPKVALGNFLAGTMRDLWSASSILTSHTGDPIKCFDEPPKSRGEYYWRQVEATRNFTTSHPAFTALHGTVDLQIEHHLFPKLPPNRLREIAPRVRTICEAHGVPYVSVPLTSAMWSMFMTYVRCTVRRGPAVKPGQPGVEDAKRDSEGSGAPPATSSSLPRRTSAAG